MGKGRLEASQTRKFYMSVHWHDWLSTPYIEQHELLIHFSFFRAKSLLSAKPEMFRYHTRLKRHG